MTAVTFDRTEGQYFYSLKNPTQSEDMGLLITQSEKGLEISITDKKGVTTPVEGHLIRGLPKTPQIPRAFFENAYSVVQKGSDGAVSVHFSQRGLGGWRPDGLAFTYKDDTYTFKCVKKDQIPGKQGLYAFIHPAANVHTYSYIGQTKDLSTRLTKKHHRLCETDYIYVCVLNGNTSKKTRKAIEAAMIEAKYTIRNIQHNRGA